MRLTPVQVRVLGCLLEKERTTPDTYPLTMNGLMAAVNQTSNRHPVVRLDEPTVANSLINLRGAGLVRVVHSRSNRADRYRHVLDEALGLGDDALALLSVLMVRGPQTASELRARSERLHRFESPDRIEAVLEGLAAGTTPVVTRVPRRPGQKEDRWAQVLGAELAGEAAPGPAAAGPDRTAAGPDRPPTTSDRLAALEARVEDLAAEVARLLTRLDGS